MSIDATAPRSPGPIERAWHYASALVERSVRSLGSPEAIKDAKFASALTFIGLGVASPWLCGNMLHSGVSMLAAGSLTAMEVAFGTAFVGAAILVTEPLNGFITKLVFKGSPFEHHHC